MLSCRYFIKNNSFLPLKYLFLSFSLRFSFSHAYFTHGTFDILRFGARSHVSTGLSESHEYYGVNKSFQMTNWLEKQSSRLTPISFLVFCIDVCSMDAINKLSSTIELWFSFILQNCLYYLPCTIVKCIWKTHGKSSVPPQSASYALFTCTYLLIHTYTQQLNKKKKITNKHKHLIREYLRRIIRLIHTNLTHCTISN